MKTTKVFIDIETKGLYGEFLVGTTYDKETKEINSYRDLNEFLNSLKTYETIVAHNVAYEYICLKQYGYDVSKHNWLCSMVLAHCVYKDLLSYSLESLAELFKLEAKVHHEDFSEYSEELLERNRSDVRIMVAIVDTLLPQHKHRFTGSKFQNVYMTRLIDTWRSRSTLAIVASEMSRFGIYLDRQKIETLVTEVETYINKETTLYVLPKMVKGEPEVKGVTKGHHARRWYMDYQGVTTASDNSIAYERCTLVRTHLNSSTAKNQVQLIAKHLPEVIKEDTGNIDSAALFTKVLTEDSEGNKIIKLDLPAQVKDYYIGVNLSGILSASESYLNIMDSNQLVYSNFAVNGTRTGRFSSSKPNMQNVGGSRTTGLKSIDKLLKQQREFVRARPGYMMLGADLDSIELAILGHILRDFGDSSMVDAINAGESPHTVNAAKWGVSRLDAKRGIFSIVYGATEYRIQHLLSCTLEQAKVFMDKINDGMPAINEAKEHYLACCRKFGGVWDLSGNFFDYSGIYSRDMKIRSRTERQVFNAVIQGTCASLVAYLIPSIHKIALDNQGSLVGVIHDEFLVEVPVDKGEETLLLLNSLTNQRFDIPFLKNTRVNADWFLGNNWAEVKS